MNTAANIGVRASVIVTTYNAPLALRAVLEALSTQSCRDFEVIVADDGSTAETRLLVEQFQKNNILPIQHVWQEDKGFRAAQIRNKAVAKARGDYLIFLDGDSIPLRHFIKRHLQLAKPGWFAAGNRILANQTLTQAILQQKTVVAPRSYRLVSLPLGCLRYCQPKRWQGAKTCNLGVWKSDFIAVNGFDERYVGWGYEDSDLVLRLLHQGVRRKSAKYATTVIHLWHTLNDRSQESANLDKLTQTLHSNITQAPIGVNQYVSRVRYPLSVVIITLNEADKIRDCLESVKWAEEIIVFDSGSTDQTVNICREYTDKVIVTDWPGYGAQKNRAIARATCPWILNLDADEVLTSALQLEIQHVVSTPPSATVAYHIQRRSTFMKKPIYHGDWRKDSVTRLFQKNHAHYTEADTIHETLHVDGPVASLTHLMLHHTVTSLEQSLTKMNQYSTLNAQKYREQHRRGSLLQGCLHGVWTFVRGYFIKLGFLDGREGFLIALLNAEGSFYKYVKSTDL